MPPKVSDAHSFVILNGTLCNETLWLPCLQILKRKLPSSHYIFPRIDEGMSIEATATSIIQQYILPSHSNVWIIGYSLGGIIALECVRQQQENIAGLIITNTNPEGQTEKRTQAVHRQLQCLNEKGLEAVFDEILLPAYFGDTYKTSMQEQASTIKSMGLSLGPEVLKRQLATLITRIDQRLHLPRIHVPTLLICGNKDTLCPPALHTTMNALIANSTLTIFEHVGHMLPFVAPQQLADTIEKWVHTVSVHEG